MRSPLFHSVLLVCVWLGGSVVRGEHEHHQGEGSQADIAESHSHQEHHGRITVLPMGPDAPTLDFVVTRDPDHGWNLHLITMNFRFAPENVGGEFVPGEGHAHLYVDGEQVARIYGSWFHIDKLRHGLVDVTVTLNGNDHSQLSVGDALLSVTKQVQCE